jgi:hypothetical protein
VRGERMATKEMLPTFTKTLEISGKEFIQFAFLHGIGDLKFLSEGHKTVLKKIGVSNFLPTKNITRFKTKYKVFLNLKTHIFRRISRIFSCIWIFSNSRIS